MKANSGERDKLRILQDKGVRIPCPESVEIGPDLDPARISGDSVTIHAGCKIYGARTLIMPGVELGSEAPVTVQNCQLGKDVKLKGGFFQDSCLLKGASMGSGAQIREGCLLEEGTRGGHTVGLKQTILFPFVTLGSLINFCDCLMAGGTDEKNHSEVGSSYIHFNYTPNQDKATPSLIGDVPKGIMINQPPIFLGGQGGLVGPVRIGYGTVVAAGTIVRKDLLDNDTILLGHPAISRSMTFRQGLYTGIKRIISQNILYISNLIALRRWYLDIRTRFMKEDPMESGLLEGALDKLDKAISERLKRLGEVADRMPRSIEIYQKVSSGRASKGLIRNKKEFSEKWPDIKQAFREAKDRDGNPGQKAAFLSVIEQTINDRGRDYLMVIKGLSQEDSDAGTAWIQGLVDEISDSIWNILPSFRKKG